MLVIWERFINNEEDMDPPVQMPLGALKLNSNDDAHL
jgi:hypothetical protein